MAKKRSLLLIVCGIMVFLYACVEKTPEKSYIYPSSSFTFLQNQYNLSKGFIINYGKPGIYYGNNINLNLISSGIQIYDSKGVIDSARGYGHLLFFEMYSYDYKELKTGTYNFDSTYKRRPMTFDSGKGFLHMDLPRQSGQSFQISSGYMDVVNLGQGNYEISFDCKNTAGETVKGNYKGSLKYYNYAEDTQGIKPSFLDFSFF